jgi:hypothetical protein
MKLSTSLKILSIVFWWYLPVYILSVLSLFNIHVGFVPDFRGPEYAWDFELLFLSIFIVWAVFLWKSSYQPFEYRTFILFTLWATTSHVIAMIMIGLLNPEDRTHLLIDALVLLTPLLLVVWGYKKELV